LVDLVPTASGVRRIILRSDSSLCTLQFTFKGYITIHIWALASR
jgi:hypothetical protein